jgi:hypothetical protein
MPRVLNSDTDLIAIPLGTRLTGLAVAHNGEVHIWIANKDKSVPYEQWQGTFIRVEPSGRISRVTIDTAIEGGEDELVIKKSNG